MRVRETICLDSQLFCSLKIVHDLFIYLLLLFCSKSELYQRPGSLRVLHNILAVSRTAFLWRVFSDVVPGTCWSHSFSQLVTARPLLLPQGTVAFTFHFYVPGLLHSFFSSAKSTSTSFIWSLMLVCHHVSLCLEVIWRSNHSLPPLEGLPFWPGIFQIILCTDVSVHFDSHLVMAHHICHDQCLCIVFQSSFHQPLEGFLDLSP